MFEALVRALRLATESHQSTTVVSVDGVGAYNHISRSCMFQGLHDSPNLASLIPLVRMLDGGDSECLFHDESGHANIVVQSEGAEQGDCKCPTYQASRPRVVDFSNPAWPAGRELWTRAPHRDLVDWAQKGGREKKKKKKKKKTSRAVAKVRGKTKKNEYTGLVAGMLHQTGLQRQGEGCILPCVGTALATLGCKLPPGRGGGAKLWGPTVRMAEGRHGLLGRAF